MYGYGYGDNNTVILSDTWSPGPHSMTWGGLLQRDGNVGCHRA